MSPRTLFRVVAVTEAITWAGLLAGMYVKYVPESSEVGVKIFGPAHGVVFIAYCLVTVLVAVDQRWSKGRLALGLLASIPPLATVVFDWYVEKRDALDTTWRSRVDSTYAGRRAIARLGQRWQLAAVGFVVAVAALTGLALLVGPPVG